MVSYGGLEALLTPAREISETYLTNYVKDSHEREQVTTILNGIPINVSPSMLDTARKNNPEVTEAQVRKIAISKLAPLFSQNSARTFAQNILGGTNSININDSPEEGQPLGGGLFVSLATKLAATTEQERQVRTYTNWIKAARKAIEIQTGMTETDARLYSFDQLPPEQKIQIEQYARRGFATAQKLKEQIAEKRGLIKRVNTTRYGFEYDIADGGDKLTAFLKKYPHIKAMRGNAGAQMGAIFKTSEIRGAYVAHLARVVAGDERATQSQQEALKNARRENENTIEIIDQSTYGPRTEEEEPRAIRPDSVSPDIINRLNNIPLDKLREFTTDKSDSPDEVLIKLSHHFAGFWASGNPEVQIFIYDMLRSKLHGA